MPVHKVQGGGYQYGKTGKKYYGKDARLKAERQRYAIEKLGYEKPEHKKKYLKHDMDSITKLGFEVLGEILNNTYRDVPT